MGLFRRRGDAYDDLDTAREAPADDDGGDLHDAFDDDHEDEEPGGAVAGAISKVLAAVVVGGVFVAAILYAYSWSMNQQGEPDEDLPVVKAEPGPEKVKPKDPGGMDVPYQDQLVLNQGSGETGDVEQLLPPPEEPKAAETGSAATANNDGARTGPTDTDGARASDGTATSGNGAGEPGDQVASTAPSRTPEDTADPESGARTAEPAAPEPQGEPARDDATAGDPGDQASESEPDTVITGETAGDDPADASDGRDTAARTDRADGASSASGGGTFLIQLAAFQNRGNAEKAWQRIQDKHRNVLGNQKLQLQRKRIPDKGIFWRVRTGPFPNRATADDLCGQLKDRGQPCLVMER